MAPKKRGYDVSFPGDGGNVLADLKVWEQQVIDEYARSVNDPNFNFTTKKSVNMKGILDALPYKTKQRLMNRYKQIIQFDQVMGEFTPTRQLGSTATKTAQQFKIDPTELTGPEANPLAAIYNRMWISGAGTEADPHHISANILRANYMEDVILDSGAGSAPKAGQRVFVFDTETSGLPFSSKKNIHFPDMRQLSASVMDVGSDGGISVPTSVYDEHFKTSRMQVGRLASEGKTLRMDNWIEKNLMGPKPFANVTPGSGDDFVQALHPFLEEIRKADVIVGHNVEFDIKQVFDGLTRTTAYKENELGFASLLDEVRDELMEKGTIRDTQAMAQTVLSEIETAEELQFLGRSTRHSLENIMLETDLAERIAEDMGSQVKGAAGMTADEITEEGRTAFLKLVGGGRMHEGQVDTTIEAYLYKYLTEDSLSTRTLKGSEFADEVRRATLRSYAPTPLSNIANISHIDRGMFDAMVKQIGDPEDEGGVIRVMDPGGSAMDLRGKSADELHAMLSAEDAPFAAFDITPVEQEAFVTRGLTPTVGEPAEDFTLQLGQWRDFTQKDQPHEGLLNRFSTLFRKGERPSDEAYAAMQARMRKAGIPFSDLSFQERWLTNAMAEASTLPGETDKLIGKTLTGRAARVSDDIGISRFALRDKAYIKGENISLPIEILQAAELAEVDGKRVLSSRLGAELGEEAEMLSLSAFRSHATDSAYVNLVYNPKSKEEAKGLADWLSKQTMDTEVAGKTMRDWGFDTGMLQDITKALPEAATEHGIGIARLDKQAGEAGFQALESYYQGILRDTDKIPARAGLIKAQDGVAEVGAIVHDRFMSETDRLNYAEELMVSASRAGTVEKSMVTESGARAAEAAYKSKSADAVTRGLNWHKIFKKRAPIVGGIAALALGGYYFGKKRSDQNEFDEALDPMPLQGPGDYGDYRKEMSLPPAPEVRAPDPLLTAGVVGNLDRRKIGHTQMGTAGKYTDLYVGAL